MRKNFIYNIIGLAFLLLGMIACNSAEQEVEPVISPNSKPLATYSTTFTGSNVLEGDTVTYNVVTDKALDITLTFSAEIVGGTGSADDIEVIAGVMSPYETTTMVKVVFLKDWPADDGETLEIEIGIFSIANKWELHPNTQNAMLSVTVGNFVPDQLTIFCDWEKDIVINSNETYHEDYTFIEHASDLDFDFEVYRNDIDYVGGAGTGDCPEEITLIGDSLTDGTYYVYSFLWANPFAYWAADYAPETVNHVDVPVTTTYTEQGVFGDVVAMQDPTTYTNTADLDYDTDGVIDYRLVGMFEVTAGVVNALEYDGSDLGGGKSARGPRQPRNLR